MKKTDQEDKFLCIVILVIVAVIAIATTISCSSMIAR